MNKYLEDQSKKQGKSKSRILDEGLNYCKNAGWRVL